MPTSHMRNFSAKEKDLCSGNLRYFREISPLFTIFTELKFCNKNTNARYRQNKKEIRPQESSIASLTENRGSQAILRVTEYRQWLTKSATSD